MDKADILFSDIVIYHLEEMVILTEKVALNSNWQKLNMRALPLNRSSVNKGRPKINFTNSDLNFDGIHIPSPEIVMRKEIPCNHLLPLQDGWPDPFHKVPYVKIVSVREEKMCAVAVVHEKSL